MSITRVQRWGFFLLMALVLICQSCQDSEKKEHANAQEKGPKDAPLFQIGSITIKNSDLDYYLDERFKSRQKESVRESAINDLIKKAQFAQDALDMGLADDPAVKSEYIRLLGSRLREKVLFPRIKSTPEISEEKLRKIYESEKKLYLSQETRKVAVLWLNSGSDQERIRYYVKRLEEARRFAQETDDIAKNPEKGFSVLGPDYSEHSASRFRGGLLGWINNSSTTDPWLNTVSEIAFALKEKGQISEVISHKEGVFLVRLIDLKSGTSRTFQSLKASLKNKEQQRIKKRIQSDFEEEIQSRHPVQWGSE